MKKRYALLLSTLMAIYFSPTAFAQKSLKSRYTVSRGFTALTDFSRAPSFANADSTEVLPGAGFSLFTYTISPRFNLINFSEQTSLSLDAHLSASIHLSTLGLGAYNLPLLLALNHGTLATHYSGRSRGFMAAIGAEYTRLALLRFQTPDHVAPTYAWVQPVLTMAYRYRNHHFKAKEISLKIGYGQSDRVPLKRFDAEGQHSRTDYLPNPTLNVKLSFVKYINY